ncbi:putative eukaryotic translation initiation factor 4H-like [Apostichopus japonicus]|uniref:Putative eukaryotic translation initiation factor 4H-like n=2 Tax=Stichopus japonicus TaxID=307972 RepID=A0A2G8KS75_STIJA|nr:putative eukaryotic translation initiation factor 4H-like [Apostichopus japonicus]PIK50863.1 putative eukaryotic translation initiation factor 4H-like [Apostichopus japonicus]
MRGAESSRGGGGGGRYDDEFKEPTPEDLTRRPKLKLKPRSVGQPINQTAEAASRSSIFGTGKPRESTADEEKEAAEEKREAPTEKGNEAT